MTDHDRWVRAQALFEDRAYREAIDAAREVLAIDPHVKLAQLLGGYAA